MAEKEKDQGLKKSKDVGVSIGLTDERPERDSNTSDFGTGTISFSRSKSLQKIKKDVQTIIDIMGPSTPTSVSMSTCVVTNSDADNEESIYTNSKYSGEDRCCSSSASTHKPPLTDDTVPLSDVTFKDDTDVSLAVEKSTSSNTRSKESRSPNRVGFVDSPDPQISEFPQYICAPPLMPANLCMNSECMCPQIASYLKNTKSREERHTTGKSTRTSNELKSVSQIDEFPQYMCPPPLVPANACIKSECTCPKFTTCIHGNKNANVGIGLSKDEFKANKYKRRGFVEWIRSITSNSRGRKPVQDGEFYKMNMKRYRNDDHSPPRKFVFQLVSENNTGNEGRSNENIDTNATSKNDTCGNKSRMERSKNTEKSPCQNNIDIPQKESCIYDCFQESNINEKFEVFRTDSQIALGSTGETDARTEQQEFVGHTTYYDNYEKTKVDVYYFDHGSSRYYKTTDRAPLNCVEDVAEKAQSGATKFWAEIFGFVHIGIAFCTSFILQLLRFILYGIIRPLTVGVIQLISDYLFKPFLATCFNAVLQPILIFLYNIFTSLRDICDPIAEGIGYFLRECAVLITAFRLVEVKKNECCNCHNPASFKCDCKKAKTRK